MEEKLTLKQALIMTRDSLADLNIPVSLIEQLGLPISRAVVNLDACINAIGREETMAFSPEEPEEEKEDVPEDA